MNVIQCQNLGKTYRIYNSPKDKIRETCSLFNRSYHRLVHALSDITLGIEKGETVGLVGVNGSGKSTLLKILSGVVTPTTGSYQVEGRIASLLELGGGFYPKFSGLENIEFQCTLMGIPKDEQADYLNEIIAFAEIGDFIHNAVRTYSSGMYVRLAFAAAMCVDPDILIVDEALAVGDAKFQSKCYRKIRDFIKRGRTLLFVSHDANAVKMLCNRSYLLHQGKIMSEGSPDAIIKFYTNLIASDASIYTGKDFTKRGGNGKISIKSVRMINSHGITSNSFLVGEEVELHIDLEAHADLENFTVGISLNNRFGFEIFGVNNHNLGFAFEPIHAGDKRTIVYRFPLTVGVDSYGVSASCHLDDSHLVESFDWINDAYHFKVMANPDRKFVGACYLDARVSSRAASFTDDSRQGLGRGSQRSEYADI